MSPLSNDSVLRRCPLEARLSVLVIPQHEQAELTVSTVCRPVVLRTAAMLGSRAFSAQLNRFADAETNC